MSEQAAAASAERFQVPAPVWAELVAGPNGWVATDEAARCLRACGLAGADGGLTPAAAAVADALPGAGRLIRLRLYQPGESRRVDLYTGGAQAVMVEFAGDLVSVSPVAPELVPSWVSALLCLGPRGVPVWESMVLHSPLMQALADEDAGQVSASVRRLASQPQTVAAMAEVAQAIQADQWRLGSLRTSKPAADDGQRLAFLDTTAGLVNLECLENGMVRLNAARTYEIWNIIVPMITDR